MQHFKQKVEFHGVESSGLLQYDLLIAALPDKAEDLKKFVVTHYKLYDTIDPPDTNFYLIHQLYQSMINMSIKNNNIIGLEILWQGIYFHDRDNPDYLNDVYIASQYGNLKTFQHVLYGYLNYCTLDGPDEIDINKLRLLATDNVDVLKFINHIVEIGQDVIEKMPKLSEYGEYDSDQENLEYEQKKKKFYNRVNTFMCV